MEKTIVFFLLLFIQFSCVKKKQEGLFVIPVDLKSKTTIPLSGITQEFKNIRLELTENSMMSDHIRQVIYTDGYLFLRDSKHSTPVMFNSDGKFIRTIGQKGQGPGEFVNFTDMAADFENKYFYIITTEKLLLFDFAGNFIREKKYDKFIRYANFVNGYLMVIAESSSKREDEKIRNTDLYFIDQSLENVDSLHLKTYVNPRMIWFHTHADFVTENAGNVYQYYYEFNSEPFLRDTLYRFENNQRVADLKLDFGTSGMDSDGERNLAIWNIYRSSRYVFSIYFAWPDHYMIFCYDTQTGESYNMEKGYEDDLNHSGIVDIRPLNTDTERYYYVYIPENLSEDENPILCIGTLKK